MAIKASNQITLSCVVSVEGVWRYYLLQSSTLAKPSAPTTNPPSGWTDTEPTYTEGSTNSLYFVDLVEFSDGTWNYSNVSLSSSYEAAKLAYNKAVAAQNSANSANTSISGKNPIIIGTQTAATGSWTGVAPFSSLTHGQQITYWLPYAGSGNATLNLTLSDGTTTGAKNCYYSGSTRLTTHYAAGNVIHLTYMENVSVSGTKYTGWWADANYDTNYYDRIRYQKAVKAAAAITAGNIIVGTSSGYKHLKVGTAFDISYPILYAGSAISSGSTSTNNYLLYSFTVTTTQSISLTAYKAVYIKGTLDGVNFTPASTTPLTQTIPTSDDGYFYMLLGTAITSTTMYLLAEHPLFKYDGESFKSVEQILLDTKDKVNEVENDLTNNITEVREEFTSAINRSEEKITSEVAERHYTKDEADILVGEVSTQLEQTKNSFNMTFTEIIQDITNLDGTVNANYNELVKYIRFQGGTITLGEVDNPLTLTLSNDRMSFIQNGTEVAYISDSRLYIADAEFIHGLNIGCWAIILRDNGNLSFKKI